MLAIIQNPKLLAGFLAAIAVVIIVIVIFMMIRGDDALGKIVYASEGDLGIRVYLLDGADEDPVSLMKDITSIKDLIRSPSDDRTLVIADTGDGMAITLLFDDPTYLRIRTTSIPILLGLPGRLTVRGSRSQPETTMACTRS